MTIVIFQSEYLVAPPALEESRLRRLIVYSEVVLYFLVVLAHTVNIGINFSLTSLEITFQKLVPPGIFNPLTREKQ